MSTIDNLDSKYFWNLKRHNRTGNGWVNLATWLADFGGWGDWLANLDFSAIQPDHFCVNNTYVDPDVGCSVLDMNFPLIAEDDDPEDCIGCNGNGNIGGPGSTSQAPFIYTTAGGGNTNLQNPDIDKDNNEGPPPNPNPPSPNPPNDNGGGGGGPSGHPCHPNYTGQCCWYWALGRYALDREDIHKALTDVKIRDVGKAIFQCLISPGFIYWCLFQQIATLGIIHTIWISTQGISFITGGYSSICGYWADCVSKGRTGKDHTELFQECTGNIQKTIAGTKDFAGIPNMLEKIRHPDIQNRR